MAYNDELGAAVVKHLARLKVGARVVKILAAVDFGGDLDKIATRGARYGMPGFESSEELRSGKTKRTYLQAGPAVNRARTFLTNAGKTPGDLAGRMVALAVMARYANEDAVARSSRSLSQVNGGGELPWSLDTVERTGADEPTVAAAAVGEDPVAGGGVRLGEHGTCATVVVGQCGDPDRGERSLGAHPALGCRRGLLTVAGWRPTRS